MGLVNASGGVVDQAGMSAATTYVEGTPLSILTGSSNQSYERKPGGATSCYDTANNLNDFALISPATPLNKSSTSVMCAGVQASTPSFTPTRTVTRTPTRTPTSIPGFVVINEFLPHPGSDWNGDGTANTSDEYIELINMGSNSINLTNWKLDNGQGGTGTYTLPNMTLIPKQITVFYRSVTGIPLSDGGGSVRLIKADGFIMDVRDYPAVASGGPELVPFAGRDREMGICLPAIPGEAEYPDGKRHANPRLHARGRGGDRRQSARSIRRRCRSGRRNATAPARIYGASGGAAKSGWRAAGNTACLWNKKFPG